MIPAAAAYGTENVPSVAAVGMVASSRHEPSPVARSRQVDLYLLLGTALLLISAFADDLGIGTEPGFGFKQLAGVACGAGIALAASAAAIARTRRVQALAPVVGVALTASAAFYFHHHAMFWWNAAVIDDAYITLRYAWMLVAGHPAQYNIGEIVEGFSSLTWVLFTALPIALGQDPVRWAKVGGVVFAILTIVGTYRLSLRRLPGSPLIAAWAAVLVAANAYLASWTMFGMETVFYTCLLLLFVLAYENERRRLWAAPLIVVLCSRSRETSCSATTVRQSGGCRTSRSCAHDWRRSLSRRLSNNHRAFGEERRGRVQGATARRYVSVPSGVMRCSTSRTSAKPAVRIMDGSSPRRLAPVVSSPSSKRKLRAASCMSRFCGLPQSAT